MNDADLVMLPSYVGKGVFGTFAITVIGFWFKSWVLKQNGNDTTIEANSTLIKNLQDERDEHKQLAEERLEMLRKADEQIHLLSEQIKLTKMWIRLKYGATDDDFKEAGIEP